MIFMLLAAVARNGLSVFSFVVLYFFYSQYSPFEPPLICAAIYFGEAGASYIPVNHSLKARASSVDQFLEV